MFIQLYNMHNVAIRPTTTTAAICGKFWQGKIDDFGELLVICHNFPCQ